MKKIIALFAIPAVAAAMTVSCTEVENDLNPAGKLASISATVDADEVKTTLDGGKTVLWESTDSISVFSASGSSKFKPVSFSQDMKTAVFEGIVTASPQAGLYPYTAKASYADGTVKSVVIPAEQKAVAGGFASGVNPAVAIVENGNLYFKNVGALVSFSVAEDDIDWVTIDADVEIAGTADVTVAAEPVVTFTSGVKTVKLEGSFENGKTYCAVVAPCTVGSLKFTFHKAAKGAEVTATAKTAKTVARNGNYSLGSITIAPAKWTNGIWDAADLIDFGVAVSDGEDFSAYKDGDGVVNMWRNVDLKNVVRDSSVIGFAKFNQSSNIYTFPLTDGKPFEGTFDGHGNTVKGLNVSRNVTSANHHMYGFGLFGGIKNAVVKNLNVEGTGVYCMATNAKSALGGLVGVAVSSTIENCTVTCTRIKGRIVKTNSTNHRNCYGGIAGVINDTEVRNCTNNSRIGCLNGKDDGTSYNDNNGADGGQIGGICGFASGSGTCKITDCINNGQVGGYETNSKGSYPIGGGSRIGGIVGTPLKVIEITGCVNNGEVNGTNKFATDKTCYVGGISAVTCLSTQVVRNCTNNGPVTYSVSESGYNKGYCGGIIARNLTNPVTIESCSNYGTVTSNAFTGDKAADSPVGIVIGRTFGISATITGCTIGGKIGPLDETGQVEITAGNYADYIYGWETAKPATVTVTGCKFGSK